jgi:hypothetical protein
MELFNSFLIDIALLLSLLLLSIIIHSIVVAVWQGSIGFYSLSFLIFFDMTKNILTDIFPFALMITLYSVVFCLVPLSGYLYGKIIYCFYDRLSILDAISIFIAYFLSALFIMGGDKILTGINKLERLKTEEYYNELLWYQIDSALAPPTIVTLLVMSGVFAGYYCHS